MCQILDKNQRSIGHCLTITLSFCRLRSTLIKTNREMAVSYKASDTETIERKGADTAESKGVDTLKQESAPQYLEGGKKNCKSLSLKLVYCHFFKIHPN